MPELTDINFTQSPHYHDMLVTSDTGKVVSALRVRTSVSASYPIPALHESEAHRFTRLADKWELETLNMSSPSQITSHAAHLSILTMGIGVVPLILERMKTRSGRWFMALEILTKASPVLEDDWGDIEAMTQVWIAWGRTHGYC